MMPVRSAGTVLLAFLSACSAGERRTLPENPLGRFFTPPEEFRGDLGSYRPVLRFPDGRPVRSAAEWPERRREIRTKWEAMLGPMPPPIENPELVVIEKERAEGFTRHRVRIELSSEHKNVAYLLVPEGKGPFPAVMTVFYGPEEGAGLKPEARQRTDLGYQLSKRGFVSLNLGLPREPSSYPPTEGRTNLQPLAFLAHVAGNARRALARIPDVDPERIGLFGHSMGGKWSLFAAAFDEKFAAVCVSDPGIVFDETRPNVNYWEPWYLGFEAGRPPRKRGIITADNPTTGPYRRLVEAGDDLHEIHALIAPRPFFVSAGSEDPPSRWKALNHLVAVNDLLGKGARVGMANRPKHPISPEANEQICLFFEHFLGPTAPGH